MNKIISIAPYEYIYVKNNNTSVIDVIKGPKNYAIQEHEEYVNKKIHKMIVISPMHYATILHPVVIGNKGEPLRDKDGQIRLHHSEIQYRLQTDYKTPFFLYHGEKMEGGIKKLDYIPKDYSKVLKAIKRFKDGEIQREVGDKWLFYGPGICYPRPEVEMMEMRSPLKIGPETAIKLTAMQNYTDRNGKKRKAGEEWLVREQGSYILDVYEKNLGEQKKIVINDTSALKMEAIKSFTDCYGNEHKGKIKFIKLNFLFC